MAAFEEPELTLPSELTPPSELSEEASGERSVPVLGTTQQQPGPSGPGELLVEVYVQE
jgi:hypothetical protein